MKVIYIHGFASTGNATKAMILRDFFGEESFLSPDLPVDPSRAIKLLDDLIVGLLDGKEEVFLVGSSLGGFYAMFLSEKYNLKSVLVNPALEAPTRMREAVGFHKNWQTGEQFEFTEADLLSLHAFYVMSPRNALYLLLLQKDDDVIDYRLALDKLPNAMRMVKTGGGHHYNGFDAELELISGFFKGE